MPESRCRDCAERIPQRDARTPRAVAGLCWDCWTGRQRLAERRLSDEQRARRARQGPGEDWAWRR